MEDGINGNKSSVPLEPVETVSENMLRFTVLENCMLTIYLNGQPLLPATILQEGNFIVIETEPLK